MTKSLLRACFYALLLSLFASVAHSAVEWQWEMADATAHVTERGTIITDGTMADLASAHSFTISAFNLTYSEHRPGAVGAVFDLGAQLPETIEWDGSAISYFTRAGLTNGSNFYSVASDTRIVLDVGYAAMLQNSNSNLLFTATTLTVTPVGDYAPAAPGQTRPVPMPGALGTFMLSLFLALVAVAGRRFTSQGRWRR